MRCINIDAMGFGDRTTSLKVYRTANIGTANGTWKAITATTGIDFTVSYGFSYSESQETQTNMQYELSYEMTSGIEFEGISESQTISEKYSYGITTDTETAYSYNIKETVTINCPDKPESEGVGLWQWVTSTNDNKGTVWSLHTVCRYGPGLYNVMPACPWNACLNGDCSQCANDWIQ